MNEEQMSRESIVALIQNSDVEREKGHQIEVNIKFIDGSTTMSGILLMISANWFQIRTIDGDEKKQTIMYRDVASVTCINPTEQNQILVTV